MYNDLEKQDDQKAAISKMTFEEAMRELEEIVKKIDSGSEPLDKAIQSFERGAALKRHCVLQLKNAKLKIEKVIVEDESYSLESIK